MDLNDFDIDQVEKELYKRSFYEFVKAAWPTVKQNQKFIENFHFKEICRHLEAVYEGSIKNLVINIPPGHGKTLIAQVFFPAWVWIHKPEAAFLYAGYNQEMLKEPAVLCKDLIANSWYQSKWGDTVQPREDSWSKYTIMNSRGGIRWAVSMTGGITGKHVDFLFIDDPIRPKDAQGVSASTKKELSNVAEIFNNTIPSRVATKKGAIIVIMQRLNELDLSGIALRSGVYELLCLPAYYRENQYTFNKIGRYDPRSTEGEILWPELFPREKLEQIKTVQLGPYDFSSQYQQSPVPQEGGVFKHEWIKFWDDIPRGRGEQYIQSWDMAFSATDSSDFVVGQLWMRNGANFYLLDQVRARMDFTDTLKAFINFSARHPKAFRKYIEKAANGPAIISMLKKDIPGLIPVDTKAKSKLARAKAISGFWEAGNVYLPDPKKFPWVADFIEELVTFDRGRHDDQVDAMSQALMQLGSRNIISSIDTLRSLIGR